MFDCTLLGPSPAYPREKRWADKTGTVGLLSLLWLFQSISSFISWQCMRGCDRCCVVQIEPKAIQVHASAVLVSFTVAARGVKILAICCFCPSSPKQYDPGNFVRARCCFVFIGRDAGGGRAPLWDSFSFATFDAIAPPSLVKGVLSVIRLKRHEGEYHTMKPTFGENR